jgi:hypothetical protein
MPIEVDDTSCGSKYAIQGQSLWEAGNDHFDQAGRTFIKVR